MSDSLPFIEYTPSDADSTVPPCVRNALRKGLRDDFATALGTPLSLHPRFSEDADGDPRADACSGVDGAHMRWTWPGFAKGVVGRYRCKLVGWPADVPFANLSALRGGVRPLLALRAAWDAGTLRFERATDAEVADPASVHPNPSPPPPGAVSELAAPAVVVAAGVLHPGTLAAMGVFPTCTRPTEETVGKRERAQREDVKKARRRPKTNPHNRPLRRARPGVKSEPYVLEEDEEEEPDRKRARYWTVVDRLEQIV
ncbi:hypothetical protein VTO73DRAFT_7682 [Trametes versicolor]